VRGSGDADSSGYELTSEPWRDNSQMVGNSETIPKRASGKYLSLLKSPFLLRQLDLHSRSE
jgi:hypothetical protein